MAVSIRDIHEKFKGYAETAKFYLSSGIPFDIFLVLSIVLVGTAGFGLGRLSVTEVGREPVSISYSNSSSGNYKESSPTPIAKAPAVKVTPKAPPSVAMVSDSLSGVGKVVASKNGTKYHLPNCPGAGRITEANKIWFDSIEAAQKAGYTPASNCKGI